VPGDTTPEVGKDMVLLDQDLLVARSALPADVHALLREATRRIARFRLDYRVPAFVPSDFRAAYSHLRALASAELTPGNLFCEWGSGFGVVTCLAAMLGYDARGIEIEPCLVDAAQQLADDFDLPVEFVQGSFIPPGGGNLVSPVNGFSWLTTDEGQVHQELGLDPEDFDIIFAYPWPDEERTIADLFTQYSKPGALLVTYHDLGGLRLRQKPGTS
jgi:hypothetical protein